MRTKKRITICICFILLCIGLVACNGKSAAAPAGGDSGEWNIMVTDEANNPVGGVKLQICSDTNCVMRTSLEDGSVDFEGDEEEYSIHVGVVPDGYEYSGEEITARKGEATAITLTAKK